MTKKIALRMPNWIGDAVMATPVISALKKNFPTCRLSIIIKPYLIPLFKNDKNIDVFIPADKNLTSSLKRENYGCAIILPNSFRSAWQFFVGKVKKRIGYASEFRRILLTDSLPYTKIFRSQHQVFNYLKLLEPLSITEPKPQLYLPINNFQSESGKELEERASTGKMLVGINPGAAFGPAKRWSPEKYAIVANEIIQKYDAEIVIFGGEQDRDIANQIEVKSTSDLINLAGKLPLRDLPKAISLCKIFITNDTGPMHVAAAVQTQVIGIFGSTNPIWTSPFGEGHIVLQKNPGCAPCYQKKCHRKDVPYECLKKVTSDTVMKSVTQILSR